MPDAATVNEGKSGTSSYVIIFSSERMGDGDDKLGKMLVQGLFNSIIEAEQVPSSIVFYNGGSGLPRRAPRFFLPLAGLKMKASGF